jgi:hypothetical protein
MTRGAHNTRCSLVGLPAPRVPTPCLAIAFSSGHMHHQSSRTGRFDLTGALLPFQPAVTRFRLKRFALTLLGHGLCRPRPDLHAHHASIDALGSKSPRGMAQILCTSVALDGVPPRLHAFVRLRV